MEKKRKSHRLGGFLLCFVYILLYLRQNEKALHSHKSSDPCQVFTPHGRDSDRFRSTVRRIFGSGEDAAAVKPSARVEMCVTLRHWSMPFLP